MSQQIDKKLKLEKAIKQVITAIEAGTVTFDHRGKVYKQEFGEAFVEYLKKILNHD